ncbi:DUF4097 family beta strand repeat-containing protein [Kitasatospora cheerisanensis]|uniref:DUF4097 domain-containing protein n=1 Tax=Kitasatospora cheerisanensis KCTC 2395 TaxID=1348663 RepID=A0A066YQX8_9ACTN|nr:DUF4097 family beta strand repeat-containing protein [Kitasatospora cheerisanensis]KDN83958.1 hypothetical protein KCH_37490 [Kitasatospora cheerisanensis KCTC 2395]
MQKFDTTTAITAVVEIPAGRLNLIASDRTDTLVEVRPANPEKNRDAQAAESTEVTLTDGVLRIATAAKNRLLGPSGALEVTVQLPAGSRVEANTADVELRGVGRLGEVSFESARGAVKLDESAGGRLVLQDGSIEVGRLTGSARLDTQRGDLTVTEATRGELELTTQSGSITVGAARGISASLDAGTGHGRIHNALRNADDVTALNIRATTANGDITAHTV